MSVHIIFLLCMSVQMSPFSKDTSPIGLGPTLMTSFNSIASANKSHWDRGIGTSVCEFGEDNLAHNRHCKLLLFYPCIELFSVCNLCRCHRAGPSQFPASPHTQYPVQCWQVLLLFGASLIFVDHMSGCWSELPPEAAATSLGVTGTEVW